jgi:hypothetical protein
MHRALLFVSDTWTPLILHAVKNVISRHISISLSYIYLFRFTGTCSAGGQYTMFFSQQHLMSFSLGENFFWR